MPQVTKGELHSQSKAQPIASALPKAVSAAPKAAAAPAKPPKLELNGKKWEVPRTTGATHDRDTTDPRARGARACCAAGHRSRDAIPRVCGVRAAVQVEHQVKQQGLQIESDVKQTVYVYQCTDSVLTIKGKANAITLDGCKKMALVFDTVVAGIELINCSSCKVQVMGGARTFTVDKCSGTQLILNRESLDAEVVSAKSSELNIVVPGANEGDEFKEFAIPEQFVSKWTGGKWVTECMAHTG